MFGVIRFRSSRTWQRPASTGVDADADSSGGDARAEGRRQVALTRCSVPAVGANLRTGTATVQGCAPHGEPSADAGRLERPRGAAGRLPRVEAVISGLWGSAGAGGGNRAVFECRFGELLPLRLSCLRVGVEAGSRDTAVADRARECGDGRIRGVGRYVEGCNISQAAVLEVIERSVRRGGVLSEYYEASTGVADVQAMARVVTVYFEGVARVWPSAWQGSPWSSRLVHGVGISAIGSLMDTVMAEVNVDSARAASAVERRIRRIERRCAWTSGSWPVLKRSWDELQNTSQDKRVLSAVPLRGVQAAELSSGVCRRD